MVDRNVVQETWPMTTAGHETPNYSMLPKCGGPIKYRTFFRQRILFYIASSGSTSYPVAAVNAQFFFFFSHNHITPYP